MVFFDGSRPARREFTMPRAVRRLFWKHPEHNSFAFAGVVVLIVLAILTFG